jgi:nucleoside-diphosphate-sugar epimerase
MRVFVTGASGWIGSAVVPELIGAGHEVVGLARSDASAAALSKAGAEVRRGDLDDLDGLRHAADAADGVIHLAFKHDLAFSGNFQGAAEADARAVEAFGDALAGSGRPFVLASGVLGLGAGRVATEQDGQAPDPAFGGGAAGPQTRMATAHATRDLASRGVRSSIVRLPPTVHGEGDHGFMAELVSIARAKGVSGYVDDGANRWPAVHQLDAARVFRLALEQAEPGTTVHAVAEEGVRIREVSEVIAHHLAVPTASIPADSATTHFGWLGAYIGLDAPASSTGTRQILDWHPTGTTLIADLEEGHYF